MKTNCSSSTRRNLFLVGRKNVLEIFKNLSTKNVLKGSSATFREEDVVENMLFYTFMTFPLVFGNLRRPVWWVRCSVFGILHKKMSYLRSFFSLFMLFKDSIENFHKYYFKILLAISLKYLNMKLISVETLLEPRLLLSLNPKCW